MNETKKTAAQPKLFPVNMTGLNPANFDTNAYIKEHDPVNNHGAFSDLGPGLGHIVGQAGLGIGRLGTSVGSAIGGAMRTMGGPGTRIGGLLGQVGLNQLGQQYATLQKYDNAGYNKYKKLHDQYSTGQKLPAEKPMSSYNAKPLSEMIKTQSAALSFGEKMAAGYDWKSILNTGLGGAAIGAGLGGLHGLLAPGEDENGKRRGRLSGALRGALGGGLLGGGAAAAGEAASPGFGSSAYNYANDLYRHLYGMMRPNNNKTPGMQPLVSRTGEMQNPEEYKRMLNNNLFYEQTGHFNMPNALSGNYLPEYGVAGGRQGPPVR